ncbi:MAG: serine/threonine protein kinase [Planctomycetes bacterium]|nr:serine/threonine protein kinase [Planctomycetota bacterium]
MTHPSGSIPRNCTRCGTTLGSNGACPRCLLELGLAASVEPDARRASGSGPSRGTLPTLDEVQAAFPELEVEARIGAGGMGAVFKARQPKLARHVALKVLARELGAEPAFAERFLREARALAKLSHHGIVAVHDFGEREGLYFLSMEFVDGVDLRKLLRDGPLAAQRALAITRELCDALQYAHDEGVVHRDIKPENVLLDSRGRVKVADFGLAKLVEPGAEAWLTRTDQVMGTPHYMAPEQMERPRDVDHRADLFAVGVVLYEMLTGSLPRGHFEPPSQRVQVDVQLDEIVLKALAREPERRYQHALEVKTDVEHAEREPHTVPGGARTSSRPKRRDELDARRAILASPIRDWRPTALFGAAWIALAALWNFGPFVYGISLVLAIGLLAWLMRAMLRHDAELAFDQNDRPRAKGFIAAGFVATLGLLLAHVGRWASWELGTATWHPFAANPHVYREVLDAHPWLPVRELSLPPDSVPTPIFELTAFHGPLDPTVLPAIGWDALSALGLVGLAFAIHLWLRTAAAPTGRTRAVRVALELGFQAAATYALFWSLAGVNYFRDVQITGRETSIEIAAPASEASQRFAVLAARDALDVDVDYRGELVDRRNGQPLAEVRILRVQAASPFERWWCDVFGASRKTPQIWAKFVQAEGATHTLAELHLGLYATDSAEFARARETFERYAAELAR